MANVRRPPIWPFTVLAPPPPDMPLAEARLAARIPPEGWTPPPRPHLFDAVRTGVALAGFLLPIARVMTRRRPGVQVPSTANAGLVDIAANCRAALARLHVSLAVERAEQVPRDGGLIFMWNQTSHLDHLLLPAAIPCPFHSLYNNELRKTPLYGAYLEAGGHFWVDRTNEAQWRAQIAAAAERIRAGACILVSPEGTRSWDGRLLPMKRGAFLLARTSGRPIVCVTVIGARACLPRGSSVVRPGAVRVVFSNPIASDQPELEARVVATFEETLA